MALACQVPVFRYALERWESDKYQLFLVTPETLDHAQTELVTEFNHKLAHTNLDLKVLNVGKLSENQLWQLPAIDTSVKEPQLALYYPETSPHKKPIITLPLSSANLELLIESPARRATVNHLLNGSSCVWLVVHHGDPTTAEKTRSQLDGYLRKIEKSITIPEGIIGTNERHKITEDTDLEDVLRSEIPLKIAFTSQLVDRSNPEEAAFIATLIEASPPEVKNSRETLIIPVFGRGRQLPPMPASKLDYAPILNGCQYLCGACSCQVKEQNPGSDLLIHENWPSHLTTGLAVVDKALPPLEGVGELTQDPIESPASPDISKNEPSPTHEKPSLFSTIPMVIGTLVIVLGVITVLTLKRK